MGLAYDQRAQEKREGECAGACQDHEGENQQRIWPRQVQAETDPENYERYKGSRHTRGHPYGTSADDRGNQAGGGNHEKGICARPPVPGLDRIAQVTACAPTATALPIRRKCSWSGESNNLANREKNAAWATICTIQPPNQVSQFHRWVNSCVPTNRPYRKRRRLFTGSPTCLPASGSGSSWR